MAAIISWYVRPISSMFRCMRWLQQSVFGWLSKRSCSSHLNAILGTDIAYFVHVHERRVWAHTRQTNMRTGTSFPRNTTHHTSFHHSRNIQEYDSMILRSGKEKSSIQTLWESMNTSSIFSWAEDPSSLIHWRTHHQHKSSKQIKASQTP